MAALVVAVGLFLGSSQPAFATFCLWPELDDALPEADAAFVGTVVAVANQQRWATVTVEEIWSGPDLPATVEVRGSGSDNPRVWSDLDRAYRVNGTYLFVVDLEGGRLRDHACSATTEWPNDQAIRFRPRAPRSPTEIGSADASAATGDPLTALPVLAVSGFAGLLVFGGVVAIRRRAPPRSSDP